VNGLHWGASAPPAPTSASGFRGGDLAPVAGSDSGEGPALRRSGGRCCCHGDSLQGDCGQEMYSRNGGAELPTHALNADFAAEEVADVRHAVDAVLRELNEAESDGEVTAEELRRVRARLEAALRETKQAEVATEFVATSISSGGNGTEAPAGLAEQRGLHTRRHGGHGGVLEARL